MTDTLERIKKEIRSLEPREVEALLRDLQFEYVMPLPEDEASVEAAWDAEIAERVKDVEDGKVKLISGEDFESNIDQLFAKHGLIRTQRA
jgi:hypothetical protein